MSQRSEVSQESLQTLNIDCDQSAYRGKEVTNWEDFEMKSSMIVNIETIMNDL